MSQFFHNLARALRSLFEKRVTLPRDLFNEIDQIAEEEDLDRNDFIVELLELSMEHLDEILPKQDVEVENTLDPSEHEYKGRGWY